MDFSELNFGVDGDSITQGNQWSYHVFNNLGMATHHNVAVGSAVWYKRTVTVNGKNITTQNYTDPDFAGISDGWEYTEDETELQKRMNNCAVVHIQRFIEEVKWGEYPVPDVFAFAMGTNDEAEFFGDASAALTGKSLSDNPDIDLFTEAGAMRWCIQKITEEYPDVRIFVLTPLQTANPEHNEKTVMQIQTIMKKVAGAMGAQIIDCYNNSGICEKFENIGAEGKYLIDGLHPKLNGQKLEGSYAAKEIRNNMFF